VLGITNAAADFLAPSGIRVNSIAPALVVSPMMDNGARTKYFAEELEVQSMFPRRFTQPTELAEAILFLLEQPMMNAFHVSEDSKEQADTVAQGRCGMAHDLWLDQRRGP